MYEVLVVGGGPAGAAAGQCLAAAGLRTAILDQHRFPRYKTCGGGLVWRARRLLDVDLEGAVEDECRTVELRVPHAGLHFAVERSQPVVTMTMRSGLDARLLAAASEAGAEVRTGERFVRLEMRQDHVVVASSRGEIRTRWVVAADGAGSRVAHAAGWPALRHTLPAIESEVEVTAAELARFAGRARFDSGVPPGGYAWVFPKSSHLSVGCLAAGPASKELRSYLAAYLGELGLDGQRGREDHGFAIPVAPRSRRLAKGRVLLTGDAAGLADPVTGEGITHAVVSGRLAAAAIVEGRDRPATVGSRYQAALAAELLPELRRARLLARVLYSSPWLSRAIFRRAGADMCEVMTDVFLGATTYRDLIRRPRNWLRLGRRVMGGNRPW